jgi:hypothetical protein
MSVELNRAMDSLEVFIEVRDTVRCAIELSAQIKLHFLKAETFLMAPLR